MMQQFKAHNGERTLAFENEKDSSFLIHSAQNPSLEGEKWSEKFSIEENTAYFILGYGLGYHMRALQKKIPPSSKVILVVSLEEVRSLQAINAKDVIKFLKSDDVFILFQQDIHDMAIFAAEYMLQERLKKIKLCPYTPAMRLDPNFYEQCKHMFIEQIESSMSGIFNVRFWSGKKFVENLCKNMAEIATNPGTGRLAKIFSPQTPVVVVGSGPSLDKNIHVLKKMSKHAVLIAAGSAMVALKRAKIVPQFLFVVDASDKMYEVLEDSFFSETVLVSSYLTNSEVIKNYPGKIVFITSKDVPPLTPLLPYLPQTERLVQSVSVSTLAVDFARICGSRKIILVGQDLSYPYGDKHHASGVNTNAYESGDYIMIPGYYGTPVLTYPPLKAVVDFFCAYASHYKNIEFINATEGGALIQGMRQSPLIEVSDSIQSEAWEEIVKRKIQEMIYSYKSRRQKNIAKVIRTLELSLRDFADKMKCVSDELLEKTHNAKREVYERIFSKESVRSIVDLLEHVVTPRLQAIEFYRQEDSKEEEVCFMFQGLAMDLQKICLEMADLLEMACEIIERNLEHEE